MDKVTNNSSKGNNNEEYSKLEEYFFRDSYELLLDISIEKVFTEEKKYHYNTEDPDTFSSEIFHISRSSHMIQDKK